MRAIAVLRTNALAVVGAAACVFALAPGGALAASTGGAAYVPPGPTDTGGVPGRVSNPTPTTPLAKARISKDRYTALAPASAPAEVKKANWAANRIVHKPYVWGGGHRTWEDRGYDCSGAVSYVLHGAGLLDSPGDAVVLGRAMPRGPGQWMTYYWNHGHGFIVIAGLRFDTSGPGERGPRWRRAMRSTAGFYVRHPEGF